jgi:hypothetical protein
LKKFEQLYIRRMARMYRKYHISLTIRQAVLKAYEAYEIYREAELEMMYEEQTDKRIR